MRAVAPLTDVVERAYAPEPDTQAWLEGLRGAVESAFTGHAGAQVYVLRLADLAHVDAVAADEPYRSKLVESHSKTGPTTAAYQGFVSAFARSAVVHMASLAAKPTLSSAHAALQTSAAELGTADIVATWGFATARHICALSFCIADPTWRMTRSARGSLARVRAHLAASWRLRIRASEATEAVLTPAGAVVDAEGEAKDRHSRERLRAAALDIARAKREGLSDPEASLAFWRAMVDGRWTLVERVDTDGKRLLFAKRNAPGAIAHQALSPKERAVLERAALGGSVRHVAYELGLPESTVSETLARAMKKLGVRSRAELVELYAAIAGDADGSGSPR